jgi:redox-sensing transcriptional repressor
LAEVIRHDEIEFGIIAVPDFAAQQVLELMIPAGIRGVLNFAPICVKGPEGCVVNNINLVTELENIIYFVHASERTKES